MIHIMELVMLAPGIPEALLVFLPVFKGVARSSGTI